MSDPIELNDDNFENEVMKSDKLVVVDFWAPWCSPCKMVSPAVEELATDYAEKLKVGKLNVDENSRTASQFGIMSIPSILFFKDGKLVDQVIGAVPKSTLKERVDRIVG
jgi:thioredoxin 1